MNDGNSRAVLFLPRAITFVACYVAGTALLIRFDTAVLGLGDYKFEGGDGGFELYFPIWLVFLSPAMALSLYALWRLRVKPWVELLLTAFFLAVTLAGAEVGFVLDVDLAGLAVITAAIGLATLGTSHLANRCAQSSQKKAKN